MEGDENLINLNSVNNTVSDSSELLSNQAFAAALAQKDAIIAALNSRIECLEQSISNQSAALAQLNQNIIALTNNISGPAEGTSKRKRNLKPPATDSGPMDRFVIASTSSAQSPTIETMDDEVAEGAAPTHNLNQQHIPATSFAEVVGKAKSKPMPLQLGTVDRAAISQIILMLGAFESDDFEFVHLKGGSPPRIFPKDAIIKAKIIALFKENKVEFNSYSGKGEKHQSFIVRGLNHGDESANITHICRSLADFGILTAIDCGRFLTGHMKRGGDAINTVLYRFTLPPNTDVTALAQVKRINGFRVTIEKMRKSAIIQCHRCQRFQHTAKQCSFEYRCVQCTSAHGPGCCPRKVNNKLPIKCCNCAAAGLKGVNHTANNLSACLFFRKNHSTLYSKFINTTKGNSGQGSAAKSRSERHADDVSRPASSSDAFIGPAVANNPNSSSKRKKNAKSSGWTTVVNKKSRNASMAGASSNATVKRGKSHTVSTSGNSNHRVEALVGAFSKLLREFCNAS